MRNLKKLRFARKQKTEDKPLWTLTITSPIKKYFRQNFMSIKSQFSDIALENLQSEVKTLRNQLRQFNPSTPSLQRKIMFTDLLKKERYVRNLRERQISLNAIVMQYQTSLSMAA